MPKITLLHMPLAEQAQMLAALHRARLRRCQHDRSIKTFLVYSGDPTPTDLTVVL